MVADSKIEWTDHTFNPWYGCTNVSPGCDNCYAEALMDKRYHKVKWGAGNPRVRTNSVYWRQPLNWNRKAEVALAGWTEGVHLYGSEEACIAAGHVKPHRPRVFCASLADVFDNEVNTRWRTDLFLLISATPHLDWLLLTKRIGNAYAMLPQMWIDNQPKPWRNVWLGATVVNQEEADRDIPKLLATPAAVRFLSIEPILGDIDLTTEWLTAKLGAYPFKTLPREYRTTFLDLIDWAIVGGESGPKARPTNVAHIRRVVQQCQAAGVPVFVKQLGARVVGWCASIAHADPADRADCDAYYCDYYEAHEQGSPCGERGCAALHDKKGGYQSEWPEDLRVREFPR